VTPIAVSLEGDLVAIHVYDNNYPGTVQRIMIDPQAETWSYAAGATSPGAPTDGWEGGLGTIEMTPMGARALPGSAPFAEGRNGTARGITTIMATSPDPSMRTGVMLTLDGTTYDTSDPSVALPEGVTSRPLLGTTETFGRIVTLPTNAYRDVAVRLALGSTEGAAGSAPVTLSVDGRNQPRVTLQGTLPTGAAESGFDIENGLLRVVAPDTEAAGVRIDNGRTSFQFPVPDQAEVEIGASDGLVEVLLVDEDGEVIGTYDLDEGSADDGVVYVDGEYDETTGLFDVTETEGAAEDVDEARTELLAGALGLDDLDADVVDDEGGQDGSGGGVDDGDPAGEGTVDEGGDTSGDAGTDSGADEQPADDPAADDPAVEDPTAEDPGATE
jgi:hypothetical protein